MAKIRDYCILDVPKTVIDMGFSNVVIAKNVIRRVDTCNSENVIKIISL